MVKGSGGDLTFFLFSILKLIQHFYMQVVLLFSYVASACLRPLDFVYITDRHQA